MRRITPWFGCTPWARSARGSVSARGRGAGDSAAFPTCASSRQQRPSRSTISRWHGRTSSACRSCQTRRPWTGHGAMPRTPGTATSGSSSHANGTVTGLRSRTKCGRTRRPVCRLVANGSTKAQQTPRHSAVVKLGFTCAEHHPLQGFPDRDVLSGTRGADLRIPGSQVQFLDGPSGPSLPPRFSAVRKQYVLLGTGFARRERAPVSHGIAGPPLHALPTPTPEAAAGADDAAITANRRELNVSTLTPGPRPAMSKPPRRTASALRNW
jgi:hypothetical protein